MIIGKIFIKKSTIFTQEPFLYITVATILYDTFPDRKSMINKVYIKNPCNQIHL